MASERVLIDSDIFIWFLRGQPDISNRVIKLYDKGRIFLSPVTIAEIFAGLKRGEETRLEHGIGLTSVVDIDYEIGKAAGTYLARYGKSHSVKIGDALIAATVSQFSLQLWTLNVKHYPMLSKGQFLKAN